MENTNKNMATWKCANRLEFEPRKWQAEASLENNRADRAVITDMSGGMTEVWCIGDWDYNWSEINSPTLSLKKNTPYVFTFWLNGGENDNNSEVCQFRIYFKGDDENPMIFRLNRNYIKAAKHNGGWYRYEIPFNTGDATVGSEGENVETTLQFAAMAAPCAFMPDKPAFDALSDEERPDPRIPQRHNIVFAEGWPRRNCSWSHLIFGEEEPAKNAHENGFNNTFNSEKLAMLQEMGFNLNEALQDVHLPPDVKADLIREIFGMTQ
ncbi:MAG: hypothetical protein FWF77_00385 [Defluviitaleaceae bacterium]|nr:hypothetical protein [Defluviitaleaceae bacterium]